MNVRNWKTRFSRVLLAMLFVSASSAYAESDTAGGGTTYDLSGGNVATNFGADLSGATEANTTVTNDALVDFEVGGVAQNQVAASDDSNEATFVVDRLVDVVVTRVGSTKSGVAGGSAVLTWDLANESNDDVDLFIRVEQISADVDSLGTAQVTNASTISAVCIDGDTNGQCGDAADTALGTTGLLTVPGDDGTNDITPGTAVRITVELSVDGDAENGEYDSFALAAGVGSDFAGTRITADDNGNQVPPDGAGSGTDNPDVAATVENVFADGAGTDAMDLSDGTIGGAGESFDGQHSARDQFEVDVAVINVTKTSEVVWDPVTGLKYDLDDDAGGSYPVFDTGTTVATPHAIPGAVVEYVITVENDATAGANAEEVVVSDNLPGEVLAANHESITLLDSTNQTCDGATATGLAASGGVCETGINPGTLLDRVIVTDCDGTITDSALAEAATSVGGTVATGAVECDPGDTGTVVYYMTIP